MILAQSGGMFAAVNVLVTPFARDPVRASLPVMQPWPLAAATTHVLQSLSRTIVYNLLALITGFAAGCRHIAGARQGFMVYFSHVIHGKFDGSNEKTSIAVRVLQAISGNTTSAPELAMKRCGR